MKITNSPKLHFFEECFTERQILFSKTILKNFFSEKFKMKITYCPKLHFFKERFTERQIFSLEL